MGSTDSIPIISQVKSLVQVISGDAEGAKRTQENFLHTAPVLSQITSAIQAIEGDSEGAKKTQQEFADSLGHFADGIPVVGHIKGIIEYATGNKAAGDASMKAASRTIGVLAGGAAGFFVGGPAGAFLGGIAAGAAMDGIITGVDSAVHHQYTPYGEVSIVTNMVNGHYDPGEEFDFAAGITFDGLAGLGEAGEGSITQTISEHVTGKPIYRVMNDNAALEAMQNHALPPPFMGGEVWIAESTEHSRAFISGGDPNRTNVLQIKIDKEWYTKMREENLVHQTEANLPEGIGKNVWNNEAGGAGGGSTGNWPGHGAVNVGIKHIQYNEIWGNRSNGFEAFNKTLKNYKEALEKPELKVTEGDREVSTGGQKGKEIKKVIGPMFGKTGKPIPIVEAGNRLAVALETNFPYLKSATDGAARIRADLTPLQDMANRIRVDKADIIIQSEDLHHVNTLLKTQEEIVNEVRGSDNLSAFNSHVKSMRLINPMKWKYKAGDWFKNWTRTHPKVYGSAVISSWGAHRPADEVKVKKNHNDESSPSDYTLKNTTQIYKAPTNMVVNGRTDAKGPLVDQPITVGGLPVKRIKVEGSVQLTNQTRERRSISRTSNVECRIYLRLRKHDSQVNDFQDFDISGSITATKKQILFDNSDIGLEHIRLGGSIELWCIVGTGRELTCTNLSCSVTFGDPEFWMETVDGIDKTIFKPARNVHLADNSGDIIPLYEDRIPLGVATIKGINVSFKAKDQGFGYTKGKIFLRIWRNCTTKTEFTDYILTGGTLGHDWEDYNWDSEEHQNIPIDAVAQLMCLVGWDGGHQLYVNDLKLILTMGRPQMETVNTIDFVQNGLVEKNQVSDEFIDLYDDVLSVSHDVKGVKVTFDAKDQGFYNLKGRVGMCVIKPSGEKTIIQLHDGTVEHNWNSYEYNSAKVMQFKIEAGDKVKFMGVVGGGGHHKLFVKNLYAVLTFHETTRVFAPAQEVHNTNSIDTLVPLYEQKFPCGVSAVTKVKITLSAKDQGFGNLKGTIYMRLWENGCKNVISNILIANITHEWKDYSYESDTIGDEIPPGSVIQFMIRVGGGGKHEMYVRNFVANITYIDSPRDETVSGLNEEIRCVAKLKQLHVTGATSNVLVNVVKPNGSIRTTLPLDASIHESTLISQVAIGDKLKFLSKSPGSHGSFHVTASFLPLETPDHNSVVIHFAPRLDFYGFVHGYGPDNILTGDDHRLELKQKLRAVTITCNWTDDNPDYHSTGKLYLVLKTKEGGEKGRYDVFGTVTHDWSHVMRVFASDDYLVKDAQPGDHFLLLREVGENGVLHIDDLDMCLMLSD